MGPPGARFEVVSQPALSRSPRSGWRYHLKMQASSVHFNCFLCGSSASVTNDPIEGGYYCVSGCDNCVRYRIRGDVVDSPALDLRSILPRLSAAARRVARDVDAGKEPPEQFAAHVVSHGGRRLLQITDEMAAAEIAANEGFLQNQA